MKHQPEWHTAEAWLNRRRLDAADRLVALANRLVRSYFEQLPSVWPKYRAVDTHIPGIGDHEFACAAYSYENLKSLVEQEPDGYGATVKALISADGWVSLKDMPLADMKAIFAGSDMDLSPTTTTRLKVWVSFLRKMSRRITHGGI